MSSILNDPAAKEIAATWASIYNNSTDPTAKENARLVWKDLYDRFDIADDGQLNQSYTAIPSPPASAPDPGAGGDANPGDSNNVPAPNSDGNGNDVPAPNSNNGNPPPPDYRQYPLLSTLGNQFGIRDQVLQINGNDPAKAEEWLRNHGYDGNASGLVDENGMKIQRNSEFWDLYVDAYGKEPPAEYISSLPPAQDRVKYDAKEHPLLTSLGNQFGIRDQVLQINGNDPAKAEQWLKENGYDGWADGLVQENGKEKITKDSEFWNLYVKAYGKEPPAEYIASAG